MMHKAAMTEALKRKKAKGLDISILIDSGDDNKDMDGDEADKKGAAELGLAPEAKGLEEPADATSGEVHGDQIPGHEDAVADHSAIEQELAKAGLGRHSIAGHALHKRPMMVPGKKV